MTINKPATLNTDQERRNFERWSKDVMGWDITPNDSCGYKSEATKNAWFGWCGKARTALQQQRAMPADEWLSELAHLLGRYGLPPEHLEPVLAHASKRIVTPADAAQLDLEVVEQELQDMAASAFETGMAFGLSRDSFERFASDVFAYARRRIEGE